MYPKLKTDPVCLCLNGRELTFPREKIAAAYAGAYAAWELMVSEMVSLITGYHENFKTKYDEVMPECIASANRLGNFATLDTLDFHHPGKGTKAFIMDKLEHPDNPFYPFFEDEIKAGLE